jgi:DNA adenine methylase
MNEEASTIPPSSDQQGDAQKPRLRLNGHGDAEPFLKWAGGKRGMLPTLRQYVPKNIRTYVEPFIGGGALFFKMAPASAILSDLNSELVTTYRVVRDKPAELIQALSRHYYDKDYYYQVRKQNPGSLSDIDIAARMIYLNRSGYNGLYRVNKKGEFNVPFGKYTNPTIVDTNKIMSCSSALKGAILENLPFEDLPWAAIGKGDFVYFDPPYVPLSKTSSFTAYQGAGFGEEDQLRLADLFKRLHRQGANLLLSNSGHSSVERMYAGFRIDEVSMLRAINSKGAKRGPVKEFLVSNSPL